jgi:hypothetical protein
MMENKSNARWIAIVGGLFFVSACAACLLLTVLLSTAYSGETVRLRNPFAPPTLAPVVQVPAGGAATGGAATGGTTTGGTTTGGTTGGTTSGGAVPATGDASAYLPRLSGYTTADASSIEDALNLVLSAQSAESDTFSAQSISLSAIATTVLVSRLDEFVACYQQSGAVDARVYIQADLATIAAGGIPPMGAVVVANNDRLQEALLNCVVSAGGGNGFSAQSADQPCGNFGTFTANNDTFTYLYAGSSSAFCGAVESHFGGFVG